MALPGPWGGKQCRGGSGLSCRAGWPGLAGAPWRAAGLGSWSCSWLWVSPECLLLCVVPAQSPCLSCEPGDSAGCRALSTPCPPGPFSVCIADARQAPGRGQGHSTAPGPLRWLLYPALPHCWPSTRGGTSCPHPLHQVIATLAVPLVMGRQPRLACGACAVSQFPPCAVGTNSCALSWELWRARQQVTLGRGLALSLPPTSAGPGKPQALRPGPVPRCWTGCEPRPLVPHAW